MTGLRGGGGAPGLARVEESLEPNDLIEEEGSKGTGVGSGAMLPSHAKVSVKDLEALFNTISMLASLEGRLRRLLPPLPEVRRLLSDYRRLVTSMYSTASSMRLVPLAPVFSKAAKAALDAAAELGKEVNVRIEGGELRVDRRAAEVLPDLLVHLVRNAVDHGIESPEERERLGKPRRGTVLIGAEREGNYVVIAVEDDGRGIDVEEVKRRAVELGLLTPEKAESITWEDIIKLLTTPGFSTKKRVTRISGRGVGLDVVNEVVKQLGGYMTIKTRKGVGTRIELYIPYHAAALSALIVRCDGLCIAIPADSVAYVAKNPKLVTVHGKTLLDSEEGLLEVVRLGGGDDGGYAIVVESKAESGAKRIAVLVEDVVGNERVVVHPSPPTVRSAMPLSGFTLLEDKVCLVLDAKRVAGSLPRA